MTVEHARAFTPDTDVARLNPSQSTLSITPSAYTGTGAVSFPLYGLVEEIIHGSEAMNGHIRTMHLLERDNQHALTNLIDGRTDVATAKERIIQNELACTRLYNECAAFVETLDQYALQARSHKIAAMDTTGLRTQIQRLQNTFSIPTEGQLYAHPDQFRDEFAYLGIDATGDTMNDGVPDLAAEEPTILQRFSAALTEQAVIRRETHTTELYTKLEQLENRFGSSLIARLAGFLALNIPIIDLEEDPATRTETVTAIDITARFEAIYTAMMNTTDPPPAIPEVPDRTRNADTKQSVLPDTDKVTLRQWLTDIITAADIDATPYRRADPPLPLLDLPLSQTPSYSTILASIQQSDTLAACPSLVEDLLIDAYLAFGSHGCVILCTPEMTPIGYLPNAYLAQAELDSGNYWFELFEFLAASGTVAQLIHLNETNTSATELHCPFCRVVHTPSDSNCAWDALLGPIGKTLARPHLWTGYRTHTAPYVDDFVSTTVPGEAQLASERTRLNHP
ncbi:hypothetical protein NGM10_02065 [Halorussus salilacus]|uniref:hypothetical protein n=1 Tax=Halorussus salilacus TaxID=2953750 RepID=UPI00209CEF85|nr:hypothetical protein [Halorussus salilacus]USZ68537.1 hypothetical protein NGM10_02065 [Halorussus salilacus]